MSTTNAKTNRQALLLAAGIAAAACLVFCCLPVGFVILGGAGLIRLTMPKDVSPIRETQAVRPAPEFRQPGR
jgi:hypothetical protein